MAIDFSTLGPIQPGLDARQESQARARTNFAQRQEDRGRTKAVEPLKAMADFDSLLAKELGSLEKPRRLKPGRRKPKPGLSEARLVPSGVPNVRKPPLSRDRRNGTGH